ncbi:hypothetical protein GCM10007382_14500 [Salinibacterium xinjiangense]|uniref:Dolichyl-phosphate-mannose-protein mannosyltransferase n=1 Tax=Salinibacterium xinjiangense TaxID=386302 RepID=A0A2C8Y6K0_9MICO|nr:hypothetical protein [Salinibacterium xinjiangense]GGK95372.1 hypothetical protein GCM10007382_14500 [Salinibacterium xinjiangense]SOE45787.1 hypothetical protein SAMN06296378_0096 [Salinibacterium xinjiangense]
MIKIPTTRRAVAGPRQWISKWAVAIVLVVVGAAVSISNLSQHDEVFSAFDEWVYYDYVVKFPTQGFVHQGEEIGEPALQAMACTGDLYGPRGEPCTGEDGIYDEPELYPQQGLTSADIYSPLYFGITWAGAQVVMLFSGLNLLDAARATGVLWLGAGLILLVLLFREFKVPALLQLGLGLATIGLGTSHYAFTYITTDAPALASGAAVAVLGYKFARTGRFGGWLIATAVMVTLLKVAFLLIVALVAIALVLHALIKLKAGASFRGGPAPSPAILMSIPLVALGSSALAELIWLTFRSISSVGPSPDQGLASTLSIIGVLSAAFVFLVARDGINNTSSMAEIVTAPYYLLVITGVLGWFLTARGSGIFRLWSIATAVITVVAAPLMLVGMQLALHTIAPISPRYALVLAPMLLVAVAAVVRNSVSVWIILVYGVALSGAAFLGLIR